MDLISREALLEHLQKSRLQHAETSRDMSMLVRCENIVIGQKTVEAKEVVHGKWVLGDVKPGHLTPGRNSLRICSECGKVVVWWLDKPTENFCSNCGADMRGEKHA